MDRKITFGFMPVIEKIKKESVKNKGLLLFKSKHVHSVYEIQRSLENISIVYGKVIPQQRVNSSDYNVKIEVHNIIIFLFLNFLFH